MSHALTLSPKPSAPANQAPAVDESSDDDSDGANSDSELKAALQKMAEQVVRCRGA